VLMSTHLLHIAVEVADSIGLLRRGRLVFEGTLEELRSGSAAAGGSLEELFLEKVG